MRLPPLLSNEKIRDIKGLEGQYAVTTQGRVWSYKNSHGSISENGGWLKGSTRKDERSQQYKRVNIGGKHKSIHRLVALTFLDNHNNKDTVNHIDGNPKNNNIENLEWATHGENLRHASRTGLHPQIHQSKLTIDLMSEICEAFETGLFTMRYIGRWFGISHSTVGSLIHGKTYNKRVAQ